MLYGNRSSWRSPYDAASSSRAPSVARDALLPLDDVLGRLRESIPKLPRSALHRCLVRHGLSRLPADEESASKRKRFAETRIGYVHIDACELRSAEGKVFLLPRHRSRLPSSPTWNFTRPPT